MNYSRIELCFQHRVMLAFLLLAGMVVMGCDQAGPASPAATRPVSTPPTWTGDGPYTVVTTTAMIADLVRHIAGERAQVRSLMGPNIDPHIYRATRGDISAMLNANVVFYNGLNLEGRMADAFVKVASAGRPVFAVTELLDEDFLLEPEGFDDHFDPHVWMDPNGWMKAAEVIADKLASFDPAYAQEYHRRAERYIAELQALDDYARQTLATVPPARRVLVTAHDAFNYFARAYHIEVRGIQGISTDSQAGLREIEGLIDLLISKQIPAVFTESSVSDRSVLALIEGARARGHAVLIGGQLFSDAMGAEGTYEGTYMGMLDHNITTIVRALGGEAPERGMNGRLSANNHGQ